MATTPIHAVRSPVHYAGAGGAYSKLARLEAEFAPLLGTTTIYVRNQGVEHFLSGDPADSLYFPQGGANSGRPRYEWRDRGDGVLYGVLARIDDSDRSGEATAER